jgi:hypothetical protein
MSSQRARQKPSTSLFFTQRWDRQFIRVRFSQIEATRKSVITHGARLFRCDFSLICHGTARWWNGKVAPLRSLRRSSGLRLFNFDWRHQIDPNEELRIPMGRQSLKWGGAHTSASGGTSLAVHYSPIGTRSDSSQFNIDEIETNPFELLVHRIRTQVVIITQVVLDEKEIFADVWRS